MCGIFGSAGLPPDRSRIDCVAWRGPDGAGFATYDSPAGPVALGHRRLSIIDLSEGGAQPMADPSGAAHLVFNGEIYNYIELRDDLIARGERFRTASDSEVLLRAYVRDGLACLPRLRGMFAFLIYDARARRLVAARDRFGIKPLYVRERAGGIAFGSEIKQLLVDGDSRRMNVARVHDFLAQGVSDHTAETMFADVRQLRGGEAAIVDCSGARPNLEITRWHRPAAARLDIGAGEAAARFRGLLDDSVRLHLRADVAIGSCLSGGLDSSSIVGLMAAQLGPGGPPVHTVSAVYDAKEVDEKPFIDAVAAQTGAIRHFVRPRAEDVLDLADEIAFHQDEPFGSTSIVAQWLVFAEAKRAGVKVMLDGQGADELLAGYHPVFPYRLAGLLRRGRLVELLRTVAQRRDRHGVAAREQLIRLAMPLLPEGARRFLRGRRQALTRHDWLGSGLLARDGNPAGALAAAAQGLGLAEPHDVASLCLTQTYAANLQMLLHWEDRNSMAHGVEARVPFLDPPLVDFALALDEDAKFDGAETKSVLRRAMADVLPEAVQTRRDKLGFATPEARWFRGPLKGAMREGVAATLALYPDLFNVAGTRALADDMLEGCLPLDFTLWRIVSLGVWGRRFGVGM